MDALSNIFKQHNLRLTESRKEVFRAIANSEAPLTIAEITKACPDTNRTSIYRIIELFHKLRIINTVHAGWKLHYELAEPFVPHHHHITCVHCGASQPIEDHALETTLQLTAAAQGFTLQHHIVELTGVCAQCSKNGSNHNQLKITH